MALISLNNLERFFNNLKTYISNALSSKANTSHTHTTADISNLAENWNVTGTNLDISFAGSSNNNGQLSIQINGTDITTFTANQITNSTFNLNFNSFGYNLIPSANETYNLGSATNNYNTVYARNINHGLSSSSLILSGGNGTTNGANLVLYGTNRSDGFQGRFDLVAKGSTDYKLTGLPSGALTWGSNAVDTIEEQGDGYIRYSNGLQICWGSISWQSACSTAWGPLYETSVMRGSYAKSFVDVPSVSASGNIGDASGMIDSSSGTKTTTPNFNLCRATKRTEVKACTVQYIAIGRWK